MNAMSTLGLTRLIVGSFATVLLSAASALAQSQTDAHEWWACVHGKSECSAISPKDGATVPVACDRQVTSPDGKRIAYLSIAPGSSNMDLFIADKAPPLSMRVVVGNEGERQLTRNFPGIADFAWLPDASQIAFRSIETGQVYTVRTDAPKDTFAKPRQISDGSGRCSQPAVSPDGRLAWWVERSREGKAVYSDLMVTTLGNALDPLPGPEPAKAKPPATKPQSFAVPPPPTPVPAPAVNVEAEVAPLPAVALVRGKHFFSMAFSPDGRQLAYSPITEFCVYDFATRTTRAFPVSDISDKLYAHYAADLAWRPDGKLIAATIVFAGGRAVEFNPDPGKPVEKSTMMGDAELFFVPVDPAAKAWWVTRPEEAIDLSWVKAPGGGAPRKP